MLKILEGTSFETETMPFNRFVKNHTFKPGRVKIKPNFQHRFYSNVYFAKLSFLYYYYVIILIYITSVDVLKQFTFY